MRRTARSATWRRPVNFSFTSSTGSSTLSDVQKALLASAGPAQLTVTPTTNPATGVITYNVSVSQQSYVVLNPLDAVAAKVQSDVYLASKSDLKLGGIANATFGPITAARTNGVQTIGRRRQRQPFGRRQHFRGRLQSGGDLRQHQGSHPDLGNRHHRPGAGGRNRSGRTIRTPCSWRSRRDVDPLDQVVAAQGGIYLKQTTGDLVLGNVTSGPGPVRSSSLRPAASMPRRSLPTGPPCILRARRSTCAPAARSASTAPRTSRSRSRSPVRSPAVHGRHDDLGPASDLNVGRTGAHGTLVSGGSMTLADALAINADVTATGAFNCSPTER